MSKLSVLNNFGSKSSQRSVKTKDSLVSKRSRYSGSLTSEHGSRFGRTVSRFPKSNDPGLVQTLSVENSRIIRTVFNPILLSDSKLPDLSETSATDSIRELGKSLNILDYEFNYVSFWLLDVLSKYLKDLQLKKFSTGHQETFLSWFRFVLRCITITGSSREEVFTLLQEMFKSAVDLIQNGRMIPLPEDIDIGGSGDIVTPTLSADLVTAEEHLKASVESTTSRKSSTSRKGRKRTLSKSLRKSSANSEKSKKSVSRKSSTAVIKDELDDNDEEVKKLNMQVFHTIIDMLYQIFAERFTFMMISLAYSSPNVITLVDLKVEFNDPKPLKTEPDPPPPSQTPPDSPESKTKGRKKSKDKGKKKKKTSIIIDDDGGTKIKLDSKQKNIKKSRASKPSTDMEANVESNKNKKDKKGKSDRESSKKGKGREKPVKSKSAGDIENEQLEEIKDDQSKAIKAKGGKGNKSKEGLRKKSKASTASDEGTANKSKKSKGKGKPKNEAKDLEDGENKVKQTKGRGKSGAKSAKSGKEKKKSTSQSLEGHYTQLDDKQIALQKLMKQFDRPVCLGMEEETGLKNKFILPLSDAVGKNYVESLICSLPEVHKKAEPKSMEKKISRETGKSRSSRHSSMKSPNSRRSRPSMKSQKKKPKTKKK